MSKPTQIPLAFPVTPHMQRADFMVSDSNAEALARVESWPNWPHRVLVLHGPAGCGKTHLLEIWRVMTLHTPGASVVDTVDQHLGSLEAETKLFHVYNQTIEQQGYLLLACSAPPAQLPFVLPDLASRLKSCPSIGIHAPDDALLTALLVKLFADRQVVITPDVLAYVLPRLDRRFESVRDFVAKADAAALSAKRAVTIPLVRDLLV